MRKLLVVLMVVAFASTAFAVDVKLSGGFEVKGIYIENPGVVEGNTEDKAWWEQDGNVQAVFGLGKGTKFTVRGDFRDGTWGAPGMAAKHSIATGTVADEQGFTIQRAFLQHVFENGLDLRAGLMATGGWGTAFRNDIEGNYRVRLGVPVANGVVTFQTTKNYEGSLGDYYESEKDDNDQYGVDYIGKTDAFTYGANLTYRVNSKVNDGVNYNSSPIIDNPAVTRGDSDSIDTLDLTLLFKGDFGQFGFESEFAYIDVSTDVAANKDYDLWGAYINGYGKFGKTTAGLAFVYGSVSDSNSAGTSQAGFDFGDDFDSTIYVDLTDGVGLSPVSTSGDLAGYTVVKAYLDYAHTDALTLGGALIYGSSNWDIDTHKDVKLYELDAYVSYDITESLNYTVQAGYVQVDDLRYQVSGAKYDADAIYFAAHRLSLAF